MRIYKAKDYNDLNRKAANIIPAQVTLKPDCVLGLVTGFAPIGTCKQLIEWYNRGDLDFFETKSVNLDECRGLTKDNDQSYYYFMCDNLSKHINISVDNTGVPDGTEPGNEKECARYEKVVETYSGTDLQLLDLGHNGHIGFNEPTGDFTKTTHYVDLAESTVKANKRFFTLVDDTPKQAYAMGIGTIVKAKKVPLVVSDTDKTRILHDVLCGPAAPGVPTSVLQLHNDVIAVVDKAAMAKL